MSSRFELQAMSLLELEQLASELAAAIDARRASDTEALADRVAKEATEAGLDPDAVAKLVGGGQRRRAPAPPKYRNPDDPSETWTGKGKRPRWLHEALEAGKTLEELLIR